jgi:hypothetical protein
VTSERARLVLGIALTLALVATALKARSVVHAARWEAIALIDLLRRDDT